MRFIIVATPSDNPVTHTAPAGTDAVVTEMAAIDFAGLDPKALALQIFEAFRITPPEFLTEPEPVAPPESEAAAPESSAGTPPGPPADEPPPFAPYGEGWG